MIAMLSKSDRQTRQIGAALAGYLKPADVLALCGDLGSGKTTFVKGLARGLGIKEEKVISPSFMLIRQYKGRLPLYHFDLYRLDYLEQVKFIGYEEYFYGDGVCCIEWAHKAKELLPADHLEVKFQLISDKERKITFESKTGRYNNVLKELGK